MLSCVDTRTCGVQEIINIGGAGTARSAMIQFCRTTLGGAFKSNYGVSRSFLRNGQRGEVEIFCFYLFTCGRENQLSHKFAAFIKKEKLGEVVAPEGKINLAYHSDHKNYAWLWSPDVQALRAWWEKEQATPEGEKAVKDPRFVDDHSDDDDPDDDFNDDLYDDLCDDDPPEDEVE